MPNTAAAVAAAPFMLPVGVDHELSPLADVRTPAQRATIRQIAEGDDFAFACNNPCTADVDAGYRGHFYFLYFDRAGDLHALRVGANGRVVRDVTV